MPRLRLCFSGAGHLLPYHLGVSWTVLEHFHQKEIRKRAPYHKNQTSKFKDVKANSNFLPPITDVSGSSSGAIAAVVVSKIPHRIEEFAHRFITDRGKALETLSSMLLDEERHWMSNTISNAESDRCDTENILNTSIERRFRNTSNLHIATTKCKDGSLKLFKFSNNQVFKTISSNWNTDKIIEAVTASCTIPASFHPVDIFSKSVNLSYPDSEGIFIDGEFYVDGAISAPAPLPHNRNEKEEAIYITVSPISFTECSDSGEQNSFRISPNDDSWRLIPFRNIKCRGQFLVKPSIQNLRALRVASGITTSAELQEWYDRGVEDGEQFIEDWRYYEHETV